MDRYLAAVENYQQLLEALRIADAEDYHILKIRWGQVIRRQAAGFSSIYGIVACIKAAQRVVKLAKRTASSGSGGAPA